MVQWFRLISQTFYRWISYSVIISQCDTTFDPKINVGHSDLCFMVQWFCIYILKTIWWMNVKLWHTDSVWHNIWTKNVGHSDLYFLVQWFCLIFLKTLIYTNIVVCYDVPVWHKLWPLYRSHWPYFMVHWFCLISWGLFDGCCIVSRKPYITIFKIF